MTPLSQTQLECIETLKEHGKLIKYSGGFWSAQNVEIKHVPCTPDPYDAPTWYISTRTINALIKKGVLKITAEKSWNGKPYPVEVVLIESAEVID